jgi:hypothetical protein
MDLSDTPLQVDGPPVHFTLYEISGSFSPFQSEPNLLEKNTASIFFAQSNSYFLIRVPNMYILVVFERNSCCITVHFQKLFLFSQC